MARGDRGARTFAAALIINARGNSQMHTLNRTTFHCRRLAVGVALAIVTLFVVSASLAGACVAASYEPNDNVVQAVGPMVGDTNYDVTMETTNDVDWFYFYTSGQAQLSISATYLSGTCGWSAVELLRDDASSNPADLSPRSSHPLDEYLFSVPGAKKFYVRVFDELGDSSVGCSVRFRVSPANAITGTPPPTSLQIQSCLTAQSNIGKYTRAIRGAERKLKKSRRRSTRRKLRRKLRTYRILLKGADQQFAAQCSPAVLELIQNEQLKPESP